MRAIFLLAAAALAAPLARAHGQTDDGSVRYLSRDQVSAAFAQGVPLIEVGDYKIHASRREGPGQVEIHTRDTDIAYVLQGTATLVTGGAPVGLRETGPEELRGSSVSGGESRQLGPGDVVVIPNGVPHWFKEVSAPFLYYVVKVRQGDRHTAGAM
jgi:glc operon protein GlcG